MKSVCFASLIILTAILPSHTLAQDCANLDGVWSVQEEFYVTSCVRGNCDTTHQSANRSVPVMQENCSISLDFAWVNPLTGGIMLLPRTGPISCNEVNFAGAAAPNLPGVVYTTNWIACFGVLSNGQMVVRCAGSVMGSGQGRAFAISIAGTSTWRHGPVQTPPEILRDLDDRLVGLGSNTAFTAYAAGPCLKYQWQRSGTNLPAATNTTLTLRRARALDAGSYSVIIRNFNGSVTSRVAQVQVSDLTPPSPVFLAPLPGQRVTTNHIRVAGLATDNVGAVRVELSLNGGPFELVGITNRWSGMAMLVPGTNVLAARASDAAGNQSAPVSRAVFYSVRAPLAVTTDGSGSVQPNLNGRLLEIGRTYTMTAIPGAGWITSGWTGGAETNVATVRFLMAQNLALTAHFVTNPFAPLAGSFRGLFNESPLARPESSGALSLTLGKFGAFSGALRNAGLTRSFTGRLDATGRARVTVGSAAGNHWVLDLTLALDDGIHRLTGSVSRADWTALLLAERAVFNARSNPAPFAPRHTFLVTGATDLALTGAGDGYGVLTTTRGGVATMTVRLADNSAMTLTAPLLRAGTWPLYQSLYGGRGCLFGWLEFHTNAPAGFGGSAEWIRPANARAVWYPDGFTNYSQFTGVAYVAPLTRADRVLALESGHAVFSGGSLSAAFTNLFHLSARGVATNLSANAMSLTIHPATGLFTGWVRPPEGSHSTSFKGAVLQGYNAGGGFLPGTPGSARVRLQAAP